MIPVEYEPARLLLAWMMQDKHCRKTLTDKIHFPKFTTKKYRKLFDALRLYVAAVDNLDKDSSDYVDAHKFIQLMIDNDCLCFENMNEETVNLIKLLE